MSDDDHDMEYAGPAPDGEAREWRSERGGGGPVRPGDGSRWVVASTGHPVCVEPARP